MAEAVYYRGKFRNKEIFGLMLRLFYLEVRVCFRLHTIWVAGMRKIAAGIDDFSRGCLADSIASSGSILYFVTFNETSFESLELLLQWVQT